MVTSRERAILRKLLRYPPRIVVPAGLDNSKPIDYLYAKVGAFWKRAYKSVWNIFYMEAVTNRYNCGTVTEKSPEI